MFTVPDAPPAKPDRAGAPKPASKPKWRETRFAQRERHLRAMSVREYCERFYARESRGRGVAGSTKDNCLVMCNHLVAWRGGTTVRDVTTELLYGFRDWFLDRVQDPNKPEDAEKISAYTANEYLRYLRAIGNHAAKQRLVRPIQFSNFFPQSEPDATAWTPAEIGRILDAARQVPGFVGRQAKHGYQIPAAVWWFAWVRAIAWAGCRMNALMLSERDAFQNGVLWLKRRNQKQKRDQRIELPPKSCAAIEDLLAIHDQAKIFPWPYDRPKPGKRSCWKAFFAHFDKHLLKPCGLKLPRGVKTRMFRRTAATLVDDAGGNAQELCDHRSRKTTETHYIPHDRVRVTRQARLIPEPDAAVQLQLFQRGAG
jgi:integrase